MYADITNIEDRLGRELTESERITCESLLEEAAVIIDSVNKKASEDAKKTVSVRMVSRAIGYSSDNVPMGATQGTMSALGYSQSWTMSGGSTGEIFISRIEKQILGRRGSIGTAYGIGDDND